MAKLQISDAQKGIVDAIDTHLHDAFLEGTQSDSTPNTLPPMELYDTLSEVDPILVGGVPTGATRNLKLGIRIAFRQVIAAALRAFNLKRPIPESVFTGDISLLDPDGVTTRTITVQDGFVVGSGGASTPGSTGAAYLEVACQSTDLVGDLVCATTGASRTVRKVSNQDPDLLPAYAVIIQKPTATTAQIQVAGPVEGIYSGLTPGRRYFLSVGGRPVLDSRQGLAGGSTYFIQAVGVALDSTSLLLNPSVDLTEHVLP